MKHIETDKDEEEEEEENDEKPAVSAMSWSTDGGGGWGASTYFLDPPTGEMVEVQPAPGRVVIMDQDVTHTVSAPSREAGGRPRYSLVWKLAVVPPAPPPPPLQTPPLPSGEEKGSASFAGADAAGSGFLPSAADIVRGGVGRDMVEDGSGSDDISISRPRMSCSTAMIFLGQEAIQTVAVGSAKLEAAEEAWLRRIGIGRKGKNSATSNNSRRQSTAWRSSSAQTAGWCLVRRVWRFIDQLRFWFLTPLNLSRFQYDDVYFDFFLFVYLVLFSLYQKKTSIFWISLSSWICRCDFYSLQRSG